MQSATTDSVEGFEVVSERDGLVAFQIRNNTPTDLYLVSEKTQSFKDRGILIPANTQYPVNGPQLWAGLLMAYADIAAPAKITFAIIKSNTLSTYPHKQGGSF